MGLAILGMGTALPDHSVEQRDSADMAAAFCCHTAKEARLLTALYQRTGVRVRHSVVLEASSNGKPARQSFYPAAASLRDRGPTTGRRMEVYETQAASLAELAARAALADADVEPRAITHLVTVSCTGFSAPGVDLDLLQQLDLAPTVARTHIGFMGCHGALNGLRVAQAFAEADPRACVLLCAVELCSLHQQYGWQPERIVANALFADGAACVVARQGEPDASGNWVLAANGSTLVADTRAEMQWRIGDHGFEMVLSPRVPEVIRKHLRPWLDNWLSRYGLSPADVGSWAIHPGGPKILTACAQAVGFSADQLEPSQSILEEFGNMSSPTILFILQRLRQRRAARPSVALAFGPGLTVEAALIR